MNVRLNVLALAVGLVAAGVARADEPSPQAVNLAAAIIADIGLKASIDDELPTLALEIQNQLGQLHPEMQSALNQTLFELIQEFKNEDASVLSDVAHVMAARMTEQEMLDTRAFFESPTGKKYLALQPVLLRELAISEGVWRPKLGSELMSRLRDEMKKKGYVF